MRDEHLPPPDGPIRALQDAVGVRNREGGTQRRQTTLTARELRAIELTAAGATYAQVGVIMDMTRTNARLLVERALARRELEMRHREVGAAKALQLERLEQLMRRWFPIALGSPADGTPPNERAAVVVLSIMDRQARIAGLEAPLRAEVDLTVGLSHEEITERQERVLAALAEVRQRQQNAIEGTFTEGEA